MRAWGLQSVGRVQGGKWVTPPSNPPDLGSYRWSQEGGGVRPSKKGGLEPPSSQLSQSPRVGQ